MFRLWRSPAPSRCCRDARWSNAGPSAWLPARSPPVATCSRATTISSWSARPFPSASSSTSRFSISPEEQGSVDRYLQQLHAVRLAYVETEALELGEAQHHDEVAHLNARALKLYLRARGYCLRAMEVRFPGIGPKLLTDPVPALTAARKSDVPLLYWTAASWGSAIGLGVDKPELVIDMPAVRALADRALALDPSWRKRHPAGDVHLAREPAGGARRIPRAGARAFRTRRRTRRAAVPLVRMSRWPSASRCPRRIAPSSSRC